MKSVQQPYSGLWKEFVEQPEQISLEPGVKDLSESWVLRT